MICAPDGSWYLSLFMVRAAFFSMDTPSILFDRRFLLGMACRNDFWIPFVV